MRIEQDSLSIAKVKVDCNSLDLVLLDILSSVKEHEKIISTFVQLKENQESLRKDLSALALNITTQFLQRNVEMASPDRSVEDQKYKEFEVIGDILPPSLRQGIADRFQNTKEKIHHCNTALEKATLRDLRKDVATLKANVMQMQEEFDLELAKSVYTSDRVHDLKKHFYLLEKDVAGKGQSAAALDMKRMVYENLSNLRNLFQSLEERLEDELNCRLKIQASEIQLSLAALEESYTKNQSVYDSKLSMYAKVYDLIALQDNVSRDTEDHFERLQTLESSIIANEQSMLSMKFNGSLNTIKKCRIIWYRRLRHKAWEKWKGFVQCEIEVQSNRIKRKKKVRQLLIRHWFGRKEHAWKQWLLYVHYHQKTQKLKDQAIKLIANQMQDSINSPLYYAFNHLRRLSIASKLNRPHQNQHLDNCNTSHNLVASDSRVADINSNQYDLSDLLDTFENDKDGAIYTLAHEINNIRTYDMKKIHRELKQGDLMVQHQFEKSISDTMSEVESQISHLDRKVNDKFEYMFEQIPAMKAQIVEMRSSLHGTINRVKIIERTHRERIELLCESKETSDERIDELESNLRQAQIKIQSLEYNNDRSQNLTNTLLQNFKDHTQSQNKKSKDVENKMRVLQNELLSVNSKIESTEEDRKVLHESIIETKKDLIQEKIASDSNFRIVYDLLDEHGVRKPKLRKVIQDGVLYEKVAKDKNYVVNLNCVLDGSSEVNMTSHIASFSHDYAAWIAFQADHEALQLVVIGKNPDEAIYVEDEIASRRKQLLSR